MSRDKIDRRRAILDAALELFAEQGFHGAPTSAIAERAGVGVGTIYRYFRTKDDLIHELFHELRGRVMRQVVEGYCREAPVRERFLFLFSRLLRHFLECPGDFRFIEQYHYSPYADVGKAEIPPEELVFHNVLDEGRQQQIIKDAPIRVLESIAFGPISALARERVHRPFDIDEAVITLTVEACWDGLKR